MQFVIKLTKLCNLRCKYCYEYPFLADKKRMELTEIEAMFRNIANYAAQTGKQEIRFVWHGGEPFTIEIGYYKAIWALQEVIFAPLGIVYVNSVQTNLTILDDKIIAALQDNLFDQIGVSVDLYGDQRVNIAGKPVQDKVLANMQRLTDAGVPFGIITVLSQSTKPYIKEIYDIFDKKGISARFLPLYKSEYEGTPDVESISAKEVVTAFKTLFDSWLSSETSTRILPIDEYIDCVIRKINHKALPKYYFNKTTDDILFIVNTDGVVYRTDDVYEPEMAYGNIFTTSFEAIWASEGRQKAARLSAFRIAAVCTTCPYFGYCAGYYIGEATKEDYDAKGNMACPIVRPMLDYIYAQFEKANLIPQLTNVAVQHTIATHFD
jgi:uncharacterized protein